MVALLLGATLAGCTSSRSRSAEAMDSDVSTGIAPAAPRTIRLSLLVIETASSRSDEPVVRSLRQLAYGPAERDDRETQLPSMTRKDE